MVDAINNPGINSLTEILGSRTINQTEVSAQTKIEAGALIDKSKATVTGINSYQLDSPKVAIAGDKYQQLANTIETVRPTVLKFLDTALKAFNGEQVFNSSSDAVSHIQSLLSLLFEVGKLNREQQALQREIAANANAASMKAQAEELSHQAKTMIAMAVVSGVAALATTVIGAFNIKGAHKNLKQDISLGKDIQGKMAKQTMDEVDVDAAIGDEAIASAKKQLNVTKTDLKATEGQQKIAEKQFSQATSNNQVLSGLINSFQQMTNSGITYEQTQSQARSKDSEALGVEAQAAKQKADETVSDADANLREIISLLTKLADNELAAYRSTINA
jgi:hypothetical protein